MKLPTSVTTKPTSGFHICDILELNKDKKDEKQPKDNEIRRDDEIDENCDEDDVEVQKENLSSESEENLLNESEQHVENVMKRKHSPSPTSQNNDAQSHNGDEEESSQDSHRLNRSNKLKMKHMKHSRRNESEELPKFSNSGHTATANHHQQLLSDTIHQYSSHLFQNHPAMRPWFNPNGKFNYSLI